MMGPSRSSAPRWAHVLKDGRMAIVRLANEADAAVLIKNINEVGAEEEYILTESITKTVAEEQEWIRAFDGVSSVLYVAEVDGRVVGQVDARIPRFRKASHVANLGIAVIKAYRGLGIGRILMRRALAWMKERGVEKATLEVFSTNEGAIALYRKMGFEVEAVRKKQFKIRGQYADDVLMAKWLT